MMKVIHIHDPFIANLTPAEFERLVYVEPWAVTPRAQQYINALHEAEQSDAVRDVLENYNLDFDDTELLDKDIEKLVDDGNNADDYRTQLIKLVEAVEAILPTLAGPAKRGSTYAKDVLAEMEEALSKINTEL